MRKGSRHDGDAAIESADTGGQVCGGLDWWSGHGGEGKVSNGGEVSEGRAGERGFVHVAVVPDVLLVSVVEAPGGGGEHGGGVVVMVVRGWSELELVMLN